MPREKSVYKRKEAKKKISWYFITCANELVVNVWACLSVNVWNTNFTDFMAFFRRTFYSLVALVCVCFVRVHVVTPRHNEYALPYHPNQNIIVLCRFLSHSFSFFFFSVQHFETTTNKSVCHFALKVNIVICQTNTPPMLIIKATVVIFYFIMVTTVVGLVFSDHYSSFSRQTHILHTSLGTQFAVSADFTITSSANGNFSSTNMLHVYRARFFFFSTPTYSPMQI